MDFFRTAYTTAKERAAKAAAEAKAYAEQAHSSALHQAEEATRKLQSLPVDFKQLDLNSVKSSVTDSVNKLWAQSTASTGDEEKRAYGITDEFLEFVMGFSYIAFRDFPVEELRVTRDVSPRSMPKILKLSPWQERHAMLLIQSVPEFNDLRYVLCPGSAPRLPARRGPFLFRPFPPWAPPPFANTRCILHAVPTLPVSRRKMPEERFWEIYFTMSKDRLPPEALQFDSPCADHTGGRGAQGAGKEHEARCEELQSTAMAGFTLDQEDNGSDEGSRDGSPGAGTAGSGGSLPLQGVDAGPSAPLGVQSPGASPEGRGSAEAEGTPASPSKRPWDEDCAERLSGNESGDLLDSDDDDDGDLDSYVEGMFNPSDADEEDDNDDFEAYMKELQGSDEPCIDGSDGEEDVSIGSDDLDLGELEESS